jgi:hypothetical protein
MWPATLRPNGARNTGGYATARRGRAQPAPFPRLGRAGPGRASCNHAPVRSQCSSNVSTDCRCGQGVRPSPGADVAGARPSPGADVGRGCCAQVVRRDARLREHVDRLKAPSRLVRRVPKRPHCRTAKRCTADSLLHSADRRPPLRQVGFPPRREWDSRLGKWDSRSLGRQAGHRRPVKRPQRDETRSTPSRPRVQPAAAMEPPRRPAAAAARGGSQADGQSVAVAHCREARRGEAYAKGRVVNPSVAVPSSRISCGTPVRARASRVPAQMWQGGAQSRRRCGRGEPSPGADVAGGSPVPAQMWAGVSEPSTAFGGRRFRGSAEWSGGGGGGCRWGWGVQVGVGLQWPASARRSQRA